LFGRYKQKRIKKENYITETIQTVVADVMSILFGRNKQIRPTKETHKRDPQKRPTKETYITETLQTVLADTADVMSILFGKYKQKRPTKETHRRCHEYFCWQVYIHIYTPQKRPTKETHKRDLYNRDPQKNCGRYSRCHEYFFLASIHTYMYTCTYVYIHIYTRIYTTSPEDSL